MNERGPKSEMEMILALFPFSEKLRFVYVNMHDISLVPTFKWYLLLCMQGNTGAASTVKEWKDFRDGKVYPGFPHAVWKLGSQPEIKIQPIA